MYESRSFKTLHLALGLLVLLEGGLNIAGGLSHERSLESIAFGTAEAVGAVLFMVPRTLAAGACILICAFLVAAAVHVVEWDSPIEHLVYGVAVLLVLAHHRSFQPARTSSS
jgi:hypothetical protein